VVDDDRTNFEIFVTYFNVMKNGNVGSRDRSHKTFIRR
jgi:hypothetical protein